MAKGSIKLFAITTAFFAIFAIIFFAMTVTSLQKYQGQKKRVHHMEQKILAGKKEILKVPEMIGKLREAHNTNKDLEYQIADLTLTNEDLDDELSELQKEFTTVKTAKAVLDVERAGYTKNLVEARQTIEELRNQLSASSSVTHMPEEEGPSIETKPDETIEEIHPENVWE